MSLRPSCLPPALPSPVQKLGVTLSLALCTAHPFLCSLQGSFTPLDPDRGSKDEHQALLSSPHQSLAGPLLFPPPLAAAPGWSWCSVPAISGTRLGQELSFNEILLKDSITNRHLSK